MDIIRNNTHLSLTVKTNIFGMLKASFSHFILFFWSREQKKKTQFAIVAFSHVWILIIFASVFKELQNCVRHDKKNIAPHFFKCHEKKGNRFSIAELPGEMELPTDCKTHKKIKAHTVSVGRYKIHNMLEKTRFSILPPKPFRYGLGFYKDEFAFFKRLCKKQSTLHFKIHFEYFEYFES